MKQNQGNIFSNLKGVIQIINELRDCGIEQDVNLPKIVVVGTQSSGKSSLLEQIVGYDFLPRGSGVVTRRPMEIRLQNVRKPILADFYQKSQPENQDLSFAFFNDEPNRTYTSDQFNTELKKHIGTLTDNVAGKRKNIVDDPIILTIYSDTCPDLTLIDLPGITRVPLEGSDQPANIEEITKNLTYKYIKDPMTIILCVIPSNQDLSVSDALQIARSIDPEGDRTFGVLTKIDIMDPGTNCLHILQNKTIRLKHGYVGIKCRSQKDIDSKKTVQEALKEEKEFFANSEVYSGVLDSTGTRTLSMKLSKLLQSHIRTHLPTIFSDIKLKLEQKTNLLKNLGEPIPKETSSKMIFLVKKVTQISHMFGEIMSNSYRANASLLPPKLSKPPIGNNLLLQQFIKYSKKLSPLTDKVLDNFSMEEIGKDLQQYSKPVIGFLPFEAFTEKVKQSIPTYLDPAINLLKSVHTYLWTIVSHCIEQATVGSNLMNMELSKMIRILLDELYEKTEEMIKNIHESEEMFIFSRRLNIVSFENKLKSNFCLEGNHVSIFQRIFSLQEFYSLSVFSIGKIAETLYQESITQAKNNYQYQNQNSNKKSIPILTDNQEELSKSKEDILSFALKFQQYFLNLEEQMGEQIPKIIQYFLVMKFTNNLSLSIVNQIEENVSISTNLVEEEETHLNREKVIKSIEQLTKAKENFIRLFGHVPAERNFSSCTGGETDQPENPSDYNSQEEISDTENQLNQF